MFGADLYVRIWRNRIRARNLKSGDEADGPYDAPFSTSRLLVGNFDAAQHVLRAAIAQVAGKTILIRPNVLMHPLEMVEGGLSQIEERIFRELAIGAGAKKVGIWIGPQLTDSQAAEKLKASG